ncbi:MAG: zinc-binding dehydrogenase, partial [Ruegeria sp.]
ARWWGVDLDPAKRAGGKGLGAGAVSEGREAGVPAAIREITKGGAHVSLDALGHPVTMTNSILCLRPRGKHVQVGLMLGEHAAPAIPMPKIVGQEIELLGSHGMQAHRYGAMLDMVSSGRLDPARLVGQQISLAEAPQALMEMDRFQLVGATVITRF